MISSALEASDLDGDGVTWRAPRKHANRHVLVEPKFYSMRGDVDFEAERCISDGILQTLGPAALGTRGLLRGWCSYRAGWRRSRFRGGLGRGHSNGTRRASLPHRLPDQPFMHFPASINFGTALLPVRKNTAHPRDRVEQRGRHAEDGFTHPVVSGPKRRPMALP
jgi:hypothetical protein